MGYIIKDREPKKMFEFFEDISKIPRGSGNEKAISEYIENFAKERGLKVIRDSENNVFVSLAGTKGRECEDAILLQGHMDMVCEKNSDVEHDFEKDPIEIYVDEKGWLRAKGTTLGGDDGAAVALMMYVLDGGFVSHPPIECLFTTNEEVGLDGAKAFDYTNVKAKGLINLDSEAEGIVTVSCAGGVRSDLSMKPDMIEVDGEVIEIKLCGLVGGHSGAEINCGRANANKLMGRILNNLLSEINFNLVSIEGGSKDNAIPRECFAKIVLDKSVADKAVNIVNAGAKAIYGELVNDDKGMKVECGRLSGKVKAFDEKYTRYAISLITVATNGVMAMSQDIEGLVEYSRNLGVIKFDGKELEFIFSSRSSVESRIDCSCQELDALAKITGCTTKHYSRYPGWKYEKESALRDKYVDCARKVYGKEPVVEAIHAGLECGIIKAALPELDIISIGPDMRAIHSPDEALDLKSYGKLCELLEEMLK